MDEEKVKYSKHIPEMKVPKKSRYPDGMQKKP